MKRKWKKILSGSLITSAVGGTALVAGSYYYASKQSLTKNNSTIVSDTSQDSETSPSDDYNQLFSSVVKPEQFYSIDSNKYFSDLKIPMLKSDYNKYLLTYRNKIIEQIKIVYPQFNFQSLNTDILFFIKKIYLDTGNKIDIKILKQEFSVDNNYKVNALYEVELSNNTNENLMLRIDDENFYIKPSTKNTLVISINNQDLNFSLTEFLKEYYLVWNTNIEFKLNNQTLIKENYCFTKNHYSYGMPISINGIVSGKSYYDIISDEQYYQNVNSDFLKENIENTILKSVNSSVDIVDDLTSLVKIVGTNPTLNELLELSSPYIANILSKFLNINAKYNGMLVELINSKNSIFELLATYKNQIANMISEMVNNSLISPETILNFLNPLNVSMTDEQLKKEVDEYKNLIGTIIPSMVPDANMDFVFGIVDKVFDRKCTMVNLLNYLLVQNKSEFIKLLGGNNSNDQISLIINLLSVIANNDGNTKVLTAITQDNSKDFIKQIIKISLEATSMGQQNNISVANEIISQIISSSNSNLNEVNLQNLINLFLVPIMDYFNNKTNYSVTNSFKSFSYENKKVSYEYEVVVEFNKPNAINLESIFNLMPNNLSINGTSIPINLIKTVLLTKNGKFLELNIASGDQLIFKFIGDNENIYLTPQKNSDSIFTSAFSIPYKLNMTLNMPGLIDSVTTFYPQSTFGIINSAIFPIIETFMKDFFIRDYEFYGCFKIIDEKTLIEDYASEIYEPNNSFKWTEPSNELKQEISQNIVTKESNTQTVTKISSNIFGVEKQEKLVWNGRKPVIENQEFIKKFISQTIFYQSDVEPVIEVTPILKSQLNISIAGFNLGSFNVNLLKVYVWFPYNILDLTNSNNISIGNTFEFEIHF